VRARRAAGTALAALLLVTGCHGTAKPATSATPEPVPPIATDPCPTDALPQAPAKNALPDVALRCIGHDGSVRLARLGGTPTVVNLWGSWCFPCRTEMPQFQQVHVALGERVRFLGVDTKDYENAARSAIQRAAITYPSVFDPDERIKRAVGTRSLPTTILVGADGTIRNVHVGELTAVELRKAITKYLGVS
jgi:cytochrome c biogenesis protein CcmG/thiol:disulfide interchange protein DsbE